VWHEPDLAILVAPPLLAFLIFKSKISVSFASGGGNLKLSMAFGKISSKLNT
jgi:hypothetical protein